MIESSNEGREGDRHLARISPEEFKEELRRAERSLARRDRVIGGLIRRYGPCDISPHSRYFETLVNSIISQQLSTRAAETIFARFRAIYPRGRFPTAATVLQTPDATLRGVGLSSQKVGYIRDLAGSVRLGSLRPAQLAVLGDDEVVRVLTEVKGIGVWTAHMFLIFSLGRLDILPVGDLGIRKAIRDQFGLDALPDVARMEALSAERGWAPWRSVVSWYLWRSYDGKP